MSVEDHPDLHGYELYKALRMDQLRAEHPEMFVEKEPEPTPEPEPEPKHIFETWAQLEAHIEKWLEDRDPSSHYQLWYGSGTIFWGSMGMDDGDLRLNFCPDTPEVRQAVLDAWNKGVQEGWEEWDMLYDFLSNAPYHVSTRTSFWG